MKRFLISDYADVADAMFDEIIHKENEEVLFVGFYEDTMEVVKRLLMCEEIIPYSIELHPDFIKGYSKEYYATLNEDFELWVQPAWYEEKEFYLMTDVDITFITSDCNSAVLKTIRTDEAVEVTFKEDDEDEIDDEYCEDCCGECCCGRVACETETEESADRSVTTRVITDDNGKILGFSKTWENDEDGIHLHTYYEHYGDNEELIKNLMENFDIRINK